jgi:hypothetical protein
MSFSARLVMRRVPTEAGREIELWRSGAENTLVRFLDPSERGKYLIRLKSQLWLLTPGAKKAVHLSPSYRLYGGATLDEVLGLRLSEDYAIENATEGTDADGGLVVFELRARAESVLFSHVRYTVRTAIERPVTATYRLRSGRDATSVTFLDWGASHRLYARRVVVKDMLRNGATTEVEVLKLEERSVPPALFDLADPSARRAMFP